MDADPLRKRRLLSIFFASCRYRLYGSPFLVSLTELSSIDIKDIVPYIKLTDWFSNVEKCGALTNHFPDFGGTWSVEGLRSPVAPQWAAMCAHVSFVISELPLRLESEHKKFPNFACIEKPKPVFKHIIPKRYRI